MENPPIQGTPKRWTRRSVLLALAGMGLAVPACTWNDWFAWNGGKPVLFGYGTAPNYDKRFKTVRIKIFKNPTFWSVVPVPGMEMELTLALVREIEQKTPYKIVAGDADTEISGSIKSFTKMALNYTQQNETREIETTLTVDVVWKDLRTGQLLTSPATGRAVDLPPPAGLLANQADPLNGGPAVPGTVQPPLVGTPNSPAGQAATFADNSATPGVPAPGATGVPGTPGGPPAPGVLGGPGMRPTLGAIVRSVAHFRPELGESISTAQQKNVNRMAEQIVSMMETPW
jgi:hypothetical protein